MRIEHVANALVEDIVLDRLDLTIEHLSYKLGIHVWPNKFKNFYMKNEGTDVIALTFDEPHVMFETFCHELGHYALHHTNKDCMPCMFNEKQEAEADKFALCIMYPEHLIHKNKLYTAQELMTYFHIDEKTALKRIEMLIQASKREPILY